MAPYQSAYDAMVRGETAMSTLLGSVQRRELAKPYIPRRSENWYRTYLEDKNTGLDGLVGYSKLCTMIFARYVLNHFYGVLWS